jgi:hypothetical protein
MMASPGAGRFEANRQSAAGVAPARNALQASWGRKTKAA